MIDKLSRFQELKCAFSKMNLKEDDYYGIAQIIDEAIERECLDSGGLKSCPFCGGQAYGQPEGDYWEMTCEECGCAKQGRDHDAAVSEWNRRNP